MDPERFDRIAKCVGRRGSRRGLLGGLLGSALLAGGLAGWAPGEEVVAWEGVLDGRLGGRHGPNRRGRDRHRAHGDKKDHRTKQDRKKKDRDGARLGSGAPCKSPQTRCGQGKNQTCVDTQTDPMNCGTCGTVCGTGGICCAGACQEGNCCTTADCGAGEQCEQHRCTCAGCRDGTTCPAGNTWAKCGVDGAPCAACAGGEICAAGRQTCATCEFALIPRTVSLCESLHDFATLQCAPRCSCATRHSGGIGVCWDLSVGAYCTQNDIICHRDQDCVDQGFGNYCVQAGNCKEAAGCDLVACVWACGAGDGNASADDGPPQIVVLD